MFTAVIAAASNILGGLESTTLALITLPFSSTVTLTVTKPVLPALRASLGYFGWTLNKGIKLLFCATEFEPLKKAPSRSRGVLMSGNLILRFWTGSAISGVSSFGGGGFFGGGGLSGRVLSLSVNDSLFLNR